MDFGCSDPGAWTDALSSYDKHMESLNNPKLVELDKLYRTELPRSLHSRTPTAHITKNELNKVMEWKLTRGKWRPRLLSFVSSLDETSVKAASQKAFAALPDLKDAVNALSTLKGVGPATASAVLAAFDPHIAPFMSDEAMVAALGSSKEYTLKQYLVFAERLQNKAKELNSKGHVKEGENGFFTASDIERALWSAAAGAKNVVDMPDDKGKTNLKENSQRKRRKS